MKIALFHEVVIGGARSCANEFAKSLREKKHIVDLYIVDKEYPIGEKKYYNKIYYYPFISKDWRGNSWKNKLYKDTVEIYKLYTLHKKIANDIEKKSYDFAFIHPSQYTQAPFLLRFLKISKLYYCQESLRMIYEKSFDETENLDIFKKRYERITRKIRKILDRKNISSADIIFTNSTFTQNNIWKAYHLKSIICHMGVDTKIFFETTKNKDIDILYIGSEDPIDGYELFNESRKYIKTKLSIDYLLRGKKWLSGKKLIDYYSRAKIVICFGQREPFGLVPIEAMSCGAIVIALNEGGYKDSVQDKITGFLVSKNPVTIAKVINNALKHPILLNSMSEKSKEEIKKNWLWKNSMEIILFNYAIWKKNH